MKRTLLMFAVLMSLSTAAHAATIHGKVNNLAPYDKGALVCGVPYSYADSLTLLINGASATDQSTALSILIFLRDNDLNRCADVHPDGNFNIILPNERYYVVVIAMSADSHVYWDVEQIDASIEQVITVTAPSF